MTKVNAAEAVRAFDYGLGYELMREVLREQMQSLGRSALARVLGVTPRRLKHFMDGGVPGMKLWKAAESFSAGRSEPPEVHLEAVAINMLADTADLIHRIRIRKALAEAVTEILLSDGREYVNL